MTKRIGVFVTGAAVAVALHLALGWWLDAGSRVAITLAVVCATTAILAHTLAEAVALWVGLSVAWTVILFAIGPGTIFPIVIAFLCGLTAMSVAAGHGLRWVVVGLRRRG
jgi:uncharacterized membrane protein